MNNSNVIPKMKVPHVSDKEIALKRGKIFESKIERIKEACTKLKNSPVSKTDALKQIKNICLDKEEEKDMWKDILGDSYTK